MKKILAFLACAMVSLSASAGYTQYNFEGPDITGHVIQHDDDKSIATFNFYFTDTKKSFGMYFQPENNDGVTLITSEKNHFYGAGPTSFTLYDDYGSDHYAAVVLDFSRESDAGYVFSLKYKYDQTAGYPRHFEGYINGIASAGAVDPRQAADLDGLGGYDIGVPRIVPAFVPEPGSLALLAIGALGAGGIARRRKSAR
jgi:hypothetical protein